MGVPITCPHCQRQLYLPEDLYEGPGECPCCHGAFALRWRQRGLGSVPRAGGIDRDCIHCGFALKPEETTCPMCRKPVPSTAAG